MKLTNVGDQHARHFSYNIIGNIASGTAPQLVLPEHSSRSSIFFQNTSANTMWIGFGGALATCTLSNGAVASVAISNGGFGYTKPPKVAFLGGGTLIQQGIIPANPSYVGAAGYGFPTPSNPAQGIAVLTNGVVTGVTITNPGASYVTAPQVFIFNDPLDPNGAFDPSASAGSGFKLTAGQSIYESCSAVTTDPLSVFCATLGSTFACRWMP